MSHTPGPWRIEMGTLSDEKDCVYGIYSADDQRIVETDSGVYPPSLADARLIASAPDLLDACKMALGAVPPECAVTRDTLERAIKKAVGE